MFAGPGDREVERITLARAIGDPVIGKHLMPSAAVNTNIRPFDATRGIFDIKN